MTERGPSTSSSSGEVWAVPLEGVALAGIGPPTAARPLYGFNPASPFAASVARVTSVTDR